MTDWKQVAAELAEALKDVRTIVETASVDEPVWLLPNKVKHRLAPALTKYERAVKGEQFDGEEAPDA